MDLVTIIRKIQRKKAAERERTNTQAFCVVCNKPTTLVSMADAIETHRFTLDDVVESAARGAFHRIHNRRGEPLFCERSLHTATSILDATLLMRTEFLESVKAAA